MQKRMLLTLYQLINNLISINDFESFVLLFPGIGKTKGTSLWNGFENIIYLTIGSTSGETVEKGSNLL